MTDTETTPDARRDPAPMLRELAAKCDAEHPDVPASAIVAELIELNGGEYNRADEAPVVRMINRGRRAG